MLGAVHVGDGGEDEKVVAALLHNRRERLKSVYRSPEEPETSKLNLCFQPSQIRKVENVVVYCRLGTCKYL